MKYSCLGLSIFAIAFSFLWGCCCPFPVSDYEPSGTTAEESDITDEEALSESEVVNEPTEDIDGSIDEETDQIVDEPIEEVKEKAEETDAGNGSYWFLGDVNNVSNEGDGFYIVRVDESHLQERYRSSELYGAEYIVRDHCINKEISDAAIPKVGYACWAIIPSDATVDKFGEIITIRTSYDAHLYLQRNALNEEVAICYFFVR